MTILDKPTFESILNQWKFSHQDTLIPANSVDRLVSMKRLMLTLKNFGYDNSVINNFHTNLIVRESTPSKSAQPEKLRIWHELVRHSVLQAKFSVWNTVVVQVEN